MDFIAYLILGFCFLAFMYFGYRDDIKRDKKEFINTILGVLIIGCMYVILGQINLKMPNSIWLFILIIFISINHFSPKSRKPEEENITNAP